MKLSTRVALAAAALVAATGVLFVGVVQAHATIGTVAWDSTASPTKVIATSRGQDIADVAGSYSVTVFDPSGKQVSTGATRLTGPKTMEVSVSGTLVAGNYRVAWTTRSAGDGDDAAGDLYLLLPANAAPVTPVAPTAPAPTTPTAPVAPPSTGDAGLAAQSPAGLLSLAAIAGAALLTGLLVVNRRSA